MSLVPSSSRFLQCYRRSIAAHTLCTRPQNDRLQRRGARHYSNDLANVWRPNTTADTVWPIGRSEGFPTPRRKFSASAAASHGHLTPPKPGEEWVSPLCRGFSAWTGRLTYDYDRRKITFIDKEGQEHTFEVADGDNLLDIAQSEDIEMEGEISPQALRAIPDR